MAHGIEYYLGMAYISSSFEGNLTWQSEIPHNFMGISSADYM